VSAVCRSRLLRAAASTATALLAIAIVAPIAFLVVLVLAGPHAGLLPHAIEAIVLAAGWIAVVALPVLAVRWTWRRLA
jgi:hypothetical protein